MAESKSYLPEDTLVHILLRLPVKSLMRFRCVCKLWYQIITSASFIDAQRKITKDKYLLCRHFDFCALISKEEFTKPGVFAYSQEFINYKFYYYPSPELYGTGRNWYKCFEVCGICNGLLCMVDDFCSYSNIHLLNPVIRKVKTIPKITMEHCPDDRFAALCFSYFDDDYKLIRISTPSCWSIYRVGVYSLRTNCWKFTTFSSKYNNTFHLSNRVMSICVGGVAYFPHDKGRIVCFDLHDERLSEVQLPAETLSWYFSWGDCREISMQACGESIALMRIKDRYLEKWVLKNRDATDGNTWETKTVTNIRTELAPDYSMESSDVGAYMLCDITGGIDNLYLCGNPEITSQVDGIDNYNLTQDLKAIDCHTANLLLLDEETLGPLF